MSHDVVRYRHRAPVLRDEQHAYNTHYNELAPSHPGSDPTQTPSRFDRP
jgi:hypothetical protein